MAEDKTEKDDLIAEFTEALKTFNIEDVKKKDFFKQWLISHGYEPKVDYIFTIGGIYSKFLFSGLYKIFGEKNHD